MSLFVVGAIVLPAQSAFATTQSISSTNTFRVYSEQEAIQLHPEFSPVELIGNSTVENTQPADATGSSTGWTPSGINDPRPTQARYASIILDLPKIDLSCSSDVQLSVASGVVDVTSTGSFSNDPGYGWTVVNSHNEVQVNLAGDNFLGLQNYTPASSSASLVHSEPINPYSTAFGLKLIVSVQLFDQNDLPIEWNVHDISAEYTYDDANGSCTGKNAPAIATSCDDGYLDPIGLNADPFEIDFFDSTIIGEDFARDNIDSGNPDEIRGATGVTANPDLNEADSGRSLRIVELGFTPQNPLIGAGTIELHVQFEISGPELQGFYPVMVYIGTTDGVRHDWQNLSFNFSEGSATSTAYFESSDLTDAKIFFLLNTASQGTQLSETISNARISVSHLRDVSVCGIDLTASDLSGSSPGGVAGAGAGAGIGTLPATGSHTGFLAVSSLFLLFYGFVLVSISRFLRNQEKSSVYKIS